MARRHWTDAPMRAIKKYASQPRNIRKLYNLGKKGYNIYKQYRKYSQGKRYKALKLKGKTGSRMTKKRSSRIMTGNSGGSADGHMSYSKVAVVAGRQNFSTRQLLKNVPLQKENANGTTIFPSSPGRQGISSGHCFKNYTRQGIIDDIGGTTTFSATTSKVFYLKCWSNTWLFCNTSNALQFVYIYDLMCIRNTSSNALVCMQEGFTARYQNGSSTNWESIGACPSMAGEAFSRYWKIRKCTKLVLAPGAHHQHTFFIDYKMRRVTTDFIENTDDTYLAGITPEMLIRVHGSVGESIDGITNITKTQMSGVCHASRSYKVIDANTPTKYEITSQLPTTDPTQIMEIDTGAVTTYANT